MFGSVAYALGGAPSGGASGSGAGGGLGAFVPLILMFVIFYFLLIRPQQKKNKAHKEMLGNLRKGDKVMTTGGLLGEITGITDQIVTLEIAPKIRVKVSRHAVAGLSGPVQAQVQAAETESDEDKEKKK